MTPEGNGAAAARQMLPAKFRSFQIDRLCLPASQDVLSTCDVVEKSLTVEIVAYSIPLFHEIQDIVAAAKDNNSVHKRNT